MLFSLFACVSKLFYVDIKGSNSSYSTVDQTPARSGPGSPVTKATQAVQPPPQPREPSKASKTFAGTPYTLVSGIFYMYCYPIPNTTVMKTF